MNTKKITLLVGAAVLVWGWSKYRAAKGPQKPEWKPQARTAAEVAFSDSLAGMAEI